MSFQRMFRTRSPEIYKECEALIRRERARAKGEQIEVLRYFGPSFDFLGYRHVIGVPKRVLDIAYPGLVFLGHVWRSRDPGPFELVHDQSSNMAKQQWMWDILSSESVAEAQFQNPGVTQTFPMNVTTTRFADSRGEKQLQICDVLAGATAAYLQANLAKAEEASYRDQLATAGIDKLIVGGLWPSADVDPDSLGMRGWDGSVAIEWVAEQFARHRRSMAGAD